MSGRSDVRVLVVEDEELAAAAHAEYVRRVDGFELAGVARSARRRCGTWPATRSTWCCWTCTCPTPTAWRCCGGCARPGTPAT